MTNQTIPSTDTEVAAPEAIVEAQSGDSSEQIAAFDEILQRFEQNSLTERDKGTAFELLVRDVLSKAQPWRDLFVKVQTYAEWAKEHQELTGGDARYTGVDLVATNQALPDDSGKMPAPTFTAIQCKFYGREQYIPKAQVDSFLGSLSRKGKQTDAPIFSNGFFVYTGKLSEHAENLLLANDKHITTLSHSELENANLDWQDYLKTGELKLTHRVLLKYQQEALENVIEGFKHHARGKLIMACGTGKTFTSLKIAERQTNNRGLVLFLVPSLALLSQTWAVSPLFNSHIQLRFAIGLR